MAPAANRPKPDLPVPGPTRSSGGFTLVELMVAISLAAMTSIFIFSMYVDVVHGFSLQATRAERVRKMVLARLAIRASLANADVITFIAPDKLRFTGLGDTLSHTLELRATNLYADGRVVQADMTTFSLRPSARVTSEDLRVVAWEGTLRCGAWVGGVLTARDETGGATSK